MLRDATPTALPSQRWFATVGGQAAGPLPLGQLLERWRRGELDRQSLVWRAGMEDWQSVAELEELTALLAGASQPAAGPAADAWRPAALSLQALAATAALQEPGLPWAAADDDTRPDAPPPLLRPGTLRLPESRKRRGHLATRAIPLALAATVATLLLLNFGPPRAQHFTAGADAALSATPPTPPAAPKASRTPVSLRRSSPSPAAPPVATAAAIPAADDRPTAEEEPVPAAAASDDHPLADLFEPAPAPAKLTLAAVVQAVREQATSVAPCLAAARRAGSLTAGTHRLILSWQITPAGALQRATLVGPAPLAASPLASCVTAKMAGWRFPASPEGAPVRNFPFGPFTVR